MTDQHEMTLVITHPSGTKEWVCPSCGYRFLMQRPPHYNKIVLECVDDVVHSGSKGGLHVRLIEIDQDDPGSIEKMQPWLRAFEGNDEI